MAHNGWVPNQHGAWAMLAVPAIVGSTLLVRDHGFHAALVPVVVGWVAGYFAFHALSLWLKSRRKPRYLRPLLVHGTVTAALALAALVLAPVLAWWALVLAPLMGIAAFEAAHRRERSLLSGASTVIATCLLVPLLASLRSLDAARGVVVPWLACTAYFLGTVLVVKTMIRERGSRAWLAASVGWQVLAMLASAGHPLLVAFFLVGTLRAGILPGLAARGRRITPLQIGLVEIVLSTALVVILLG